MNKGRKVMAVVIVYLLLSLRKGSGGKYAR